MINIRDVLDLIEQYAAESSDLAVNEYQCRLLATLGARIGVDVATAGEALDIKRKGSARLILERLERIAKGEAVVNEAN